MSAQRPNTGMRVSFRLGDVVCPDFEQIVAQTGSELTVEGEIVLTSDKGRERDHYAIVQVNGIEPPLIVPMRMLVSSGQPNPLANRASGPANS